MSARPAHTTRSSSRTPGRACATVSQSWSSWTAHGTSLPRSCGARRGPMLSRPASQPKVACRSRRATFGTRPWPPSDASCADTAGERLLPLGAAAISSRTQEAAAGLVRARVSRCVSASPSSAVATAKAMAYRQWGKDVGAAADLSGVCPSRSAWAAKCCSNRGARSAADRRRGRRGRFPPAPRPDAAGQTNWPGRGLADPGSARRGGAALPIRPVRPAGARAGGCGWRARRATRAR